MQHFVSFRTIFEAFDEEGEEKESVEQAQEWHLQRTAQRESVSKFE
jgi:hypothetical protein